MSKTQHFNSYSIRTIGIRGSTASMRRAPPESSKNKKHSNNGRRIPRPSGDAASPTRLPPPVTHGRRPNHRRLQARRRTAREDGASLLDQPANAGMIWLRRTAQSCAFFVARMIRTTAGHTAVVLHHSDDGSNASGGADRFTGTTGGSKCGGAATRRGKIQQSNTKIIHARH